MAVLLVETVAQSNRCPPSGIPRPPPPWRRVRAPMLPPGHEAGGDGVKTRAALLWGVGQDWKVEEIDLDPPKAGEVLVQMKAAGLCHSDEHLVTGDMVFPPEAEVA